MAIRVALNHETIYRYDRRVALTPQIVRLRPAPHGRTPVTSYRAAPTLGQDAFEILTELLGYDVDRVADLAAAELLE